MTAEKDSTPRVLRGGSWGSDAQYARAAYRSIVSPGYGFQIIGFRLVRTACSPSPLLPSNAPTKNDLWLAYRRKARKEFLKLWKDAATIKETK